MSEHDIIASQANRIRYLEELCEYLLKELDKAKKPRVETNIYDKVTRYTNCTVEVLENTTTGETSVGWYRTERTEEE